MNFIEINDELVNLSNVLIIERSNKWEETKRGDIFTTITIRFINGSEVSYRVSLNFLEELEKRCLL